jgi:hypothetical protein
MESRTRSGFFINQPNKYQVWLTKAGTNQDFLVDFYKSNLESAIKRAEDFQEQAKNSYGVGILQNVTDEVLIAETVFDGRFLIIAVENDYLKGFNKPEPLKQELRLV